MSFTGWSLFRCVVWTTVTVWKTADQKYLVTVLKNSWSETKSDQRNWVPVTGHPLEIESKTPQLSTLQRNQLFGNAIINSFQGEYLKKW